MEIGRYCTPESGASDPVYANYHATCAAAMDGLLDPGRVIVEASAPLRAPAYGDPTCLPEPAGADAGKPVTEEAVPPGAVSWAAAEGSATLDFAVTMSVRWCPSGVRRRRRR